MKKFISLALATAMIASMSVPAFAFTKQPIKGGVGNTGFNTTGQTFDVDDVRLSRVTQHRIMDSGVRILFFPFEVKDGSNRYLIQQQQMGEAAYTGGELATVPVSAVDDFQELTWTVKFDKDCAQFLRVAEQIHDVPTWIVSSTAHAEKDGNYSDMDAGISTIFYSEMEGLKVVLNDNNTTDNYRISGTVTLKHKGKKLDEYDFSYNFKNIAVTADQGLFDENGLAIKIADSGQYEVVHLSDYGKLDDFVSEVDDDTATIDLRGVSRSVKIVDFKKSVEEIELEDHHGFYFNVKASDQGKVNLSYENNINYTNMWMAMYYMGQNPIPAGADVRYFNFKAKPEFDFTGKVTIELPDPDVQWYLYDLDPNAISWSPIEHAVLTEEGDAFEFKARKLGCYMLSDVELVMPGTEGTTEGEVEDVNPSTGGPE